MAFVFFWGGFLYHEILNDLIINPWDCQLVAHHKIKISIYYLSPNLMYPLSSGQSAKLTDCVLNIHSAYQLITTEWYNPKNQWAMWSESIFLHPKLPILVSIYQRDLTVRPMEHPFILSSVIIWSVFYNLAMSAKQITVITWPICSLESLETRPFVKKIDRLSPIWLPFIPKDQYNVLWMSGRVTVRENDSIWSTALFIQRYEQFSVITKQWSKS